MQQAKASNRIFALLLDLAIVYLFSLLIAIRPILALVDALVNQTSGNTWSLFISALLAGGVVVIFLLFYLLVLPLYWNGQTVGKKFFGIRVVRNDGGPLTFQTLFIREVVGRILIILVSVGFSLIADFISLIANDHHLTFHDTLSYTKVINVE